MAASYPSGYNTYIPNTDATNNMVVDFSRNPQAFKLPEWTQYVPVTKNIGRYIEMTVEMAGRLLNADGADFLWADGNQRPSNQGNTEAFEFKPYQTRRFQTGFNLGELSAEQAEWDILAHHARIHAQRMMTLRTQLAVTVATNASLYAVSHTSAVASISGVTDKWDLSTTARSDIKRSLDYAADIIRKDTLGAVKPDQLMLVLSPGAARKIAVCQEIRDYIKGSPDASKLITSNLGKHNNYGLPDTLFDYKVVVEDAVKVTSRKGATKATSDILADATPFLCARPGELEGIEGAPSFSSFTIFLKEELTVEEKHDRDNRRHQGSVVDDQVCTFTAPVSSFLFTAAVN